MSSKTSTESFGGMAIFVVTFLALWIELMTLMPSSFYVMSKQYSNYDVPDYFTQEDIAHIKHYKDQNITRGDIFGQPETWFDFNPDVNFKFWVQWYGGGLDYVSIGHLTWEFLIFSSGHYMEVEQQDTRIYKSEVLANWDDNISVTVFYPVRCVDVTVKVWLTDKNQTRNDIGTAWDEGNLAMGIGFGYEDYETKLGTWDILGRLLTFQSPEIFGLAGAFATVVNLIITLPFYVCVAYLIYRLILFALPFV